MHKLRIGNKGSITVEMSFIVPIIIGIIMLIIFTLIKSKEDAQWQSDNYVGLYLYDEEMIQGECSDRLRRWQLYGDVLSE